MQRSTPSATAATETPTLAPGVDSSTQLSALSRACRSAVWFATTVGNASATATSIRNPRRSASFCTTAMTPRSVSPTSIGSPGGTAPMRRSSTSSDASSSPDDRSAASSSGATNRAAPGSI